MDPSMYLMNQQYYIQPQQTTIMTTNNRIMQSNHNLMQTQNNHVNMNSNQMINQNLNHNNRVVVDKMDAKGKKPKGRMSAYTFFVQMCREEHRKQHPNENVNFTEFSKKCAERWKQMSDAEKKRFAEMAEKDKQRYDREMASYTPANGGDSHGRKRKKKDPNAPKRPLSAFFLFCADERPSVKALYPSYSVGETAKELGERWNKVTAEVKAKYEARVALDKGRYEREVQNYKNRQNKADVGADEIGEEEDEEDDGDE